MLRTGRESSQDLERIGLLGMVILENAEVMSKSVCRLVIWKLEIVLMKLGTSNKSKVVWT